MACFERPIVDSCNPSVLAEGPSPDFVGVYKAYGIASAGALVVVRPDGYVGTTVPFHGVDSGLSAYLAMFLK